ncbi:MAG: calcium-binding protein [Phycisphaerae bacterium]
MGYHIEQVANMNDKCGEAPTWDATGRRLLWVDNESDLVHEFSTDTGRIAVLSRGLNVSGIALHRGPGLVFGGATGLHLWLGQDNYRTIASEYQGETLSINDLIAGPHGRIYAGTLYWGPDGMEKPGRLYLIGGDGSVRVVEEGVHLSNGLGFSPDDRTLYYTDSSRRLIYAYDVQADGGLARRRVFVRVPDDEGLPDGLTVDADGFVWSAQWYGGQVVRYDPQGRVALRIRMPMLQVSSATFGGADLTDLYVTTAGHSWRGGPAPPGYDFDAPNIGGPLYRVRLDVRGRLEHQADFR